MLHSSRDVAMCGNAHCNGPIQWARAAARPHHKARDSKERLDAAAARLWHPYAGTHTRNSVISPRCSGARLLVRARCKLAQAPPLCGQLIVTPERGTERGTGQMKNTACIDSIAASIDSTASMHTTVHVSCPSFSPSFTLLFMCPVPLSVPLSHYNTVNRGSSHNSVNRGGVNMGGLNIPEPWQSTDNPYVFNSRMYVLWDTRMHQDSCSTSVHRVQYAQIVELTM